MILQQGTPTDSGRGMPDAFLSALQPDNEDRDIKLPPRRGTYSRTPVVPRSLTTGGVLLLEDDPAFRQVIADFLMDLGFSVTAVQSGLEGIQAVLSGQYAVILCDMRMPGLPGDLFYRAVERA